MKSDRKVISGLVTVAMAATMALTSATPLSAQPPEDWVVDYRAGVNFK